MKAHIPVVQDPVVDAIAFVLPWGVDLPQDEQTQNVSPLLRRLNNEIENGECERAYPRGGRYRDSVRIHFEKRHHALVQIGAVRPDNQKGGIRISVNPSRFIHGDVEHLHTFMKRVVGREYTKLLSSALLNRVDFAVDVHHADLNRMLVSYDHAQHRTIFAKRVTSAGRIEGYNFGSVKSDYMTTAYDKRGERIHAAIVNLLKYGKGNDELRDNAIKQLERERDSHEVIRIEVRGKKLRGLPLWDLGSLPNRFARFHFADLSRGGTELSEFDKAVFHSMSQQLGVRAALALFKNTSQSRQVLQYWKSHQASWWNPGPLWADACRAMRETGLFHAQAFERPKVRNLASPSVSKRDMPPG